MSSERATSEESSAARKRVESLRERVQTSEQIKVADRELLIAFSDRLDLLAQDYTDLRHKKLLGVCVRISERHGGLADALQDKQVAESVVAWINREFENEETNRDYRSALRVFGKRVAETHAVRDVETDTNGVPETLAWVSTSTSSDYDPTPDPRDMLHWNDHIIPMIEHCLNPRDRAFIAVQFDGGFRGGEFKDLQLGDVQDHKYGLQITVEGKQGRRTVPLIPSVPYLNDWLRHHPADRTNGEAPLWSKLSSPDPLSNKMCTKILQEAAERAGMKRNVTMTIVRKSSAAFLASRNLNQAHIEDHHGWVRGSRAAARYISVFGADTDREIARLHGMDIAEDDEPDPITPVECTRCGEEVPRHEQACGRCGQAMTPEAAQELVTHERPGDDFDISAVGRCGACGTAPAPVVRVGESWECYECGGEP